MLYSTLVAAEGLLFTPAAQLESGMHLQPASEITLLAQSALEQPGLVWAVLGGLAVGIGVHWISSRRTIGSARSAAATELAGAESKAKALHTKARAAAAKEKEQWTSEFSTERKDIEDGLEELNGLLDDRERDLDRRDEELAGRSEKVEELKKELRLLKTQRRRRERDLRRTRVEQKEELLSRAGMTEESAREMILNVLTEEVSKEQHNLFAKRLELLSDDLEKIARKIILIAIGRCNIKHPETGFTAALTLPNKGFKNRLVGPEGANQQLFEELTGVNLIFDEDEPLNLILSAYDGMRKAIARRTIEKLISQNQPIQPAKIKEFVDKSTREMKRIILDGGRKVCSNMRMKGIHPEIQSLLGRLNYRTSYGQNVLKHSKEVAFLASTVAAEIGADTKLAKRCGLLHDIGKAVDAEIEGGHPEIGAEIATRCNETQPVLDAIALHHEDPDKLGMYTHLTQTGDAISGSRPGARRETLERYLKHLEDLETIGNNAPGVDNAYAIQAGRELRVFVDPKKVSDDKALEICKGITARVEDELTYPGKIKITVVRESRASAMAR